MTLVAAQVFRDYEVDAVPASGKHSVLKSEVRALLTSYETSLGLAGGAVKGTYNTLALAAAADLSAYTYIETLGRNAINDNGGALYTKISPTTTSAWRFQSLDGQWWGLFNRTVTPEMFRLTGDTDWTNAFNALGTWLNIVLKGVVVNYNPGVDYDIWPSGSPGNLISLVQCDSITFNFRGARMISNRSSWSNAPQIFFLQNCSNITINNPKWVEPNWSGTLIDTAGPYFIFVYDDVVNTPSKNILVTNLYQSGGVAGLAAGCDQTKAGGRGKNIALINAEFNNCYYPMNFQGNGDHFFARGIKCNNSGRCYFPWNVSFHDVEVESNFGGTFNDVMLKCYARQAYDVDKCVLSFIKVKYKNTSRAANVSAQSLTNISIQQFEATVAVTGAANNGSGLVRLAMSSTASMVTGQTRFIAAVGGIANINLKPWKVTVIDSTHIDLQGSTFSGTYTSGGVISVPGVLRNIEIDVEIDDISGNRQPTAFDTYRLDNNAAADTGSRGYVVENFRLSGSIRNYNYGVAICDVFGNNTFGASNGLNSLGTWQDDIIRNINFEKLALDGSSTSFTVLATQVFSGPLKFYEISVTAGITVTITRFAFAGTAGTVTSEDEVTIAPTNTFTLTLPAASAFPGREIFVKTTAAFAINSASSNVVAITGGAASTAILAATSGKWARLKSDGANWLIWASN